jgi:hypothetical protein
MSVKGSRQEGFMDFKGSIVRKIAVKEARSALENTLTLVGNTLGGSRSGAIELSAVAR